MKKNIVFYIFCSLLLITLLFASNVFSEIKHFEKVGIGKLRTRDKLFMFFAVPCLFLGILQLAQIDITNFGILVTLLGLLGAFLSISVWVLSPINAVSSSDDHPFTRSSEETSFVTV